MGLLTEPLNQNAHTLPQKLATEPVTYLFLNGQQIDIALLFHSGTDVVGQAFVRARAWAG